MVIYFSLTKSCNLEVTPWRWR